MSLKLLSGEAARFELKQLKSSGLRPTSAMLKRKFFDAYRSEIPGSNFIDLCAGSGSVALEAFSRRADSVICVDTSIKAIESLKQNKVLILHLKQHN